MYQGITQILKQIHLMMFVLFFLTCTQKTPIDPSTQIHKDMPILVGMRTTPNTIGVGGAFSLVDIRLLDSEGRPIENVNISFSTTLGTITKSAKTDTAGWAQAVIQSGETPGTASVTAVYQANIQKTIQIEFIENPDFELIIQAEKSVLYANGIDTTVITILVSADTTYDPTGLSYKTSAGALSYSTDGARLLLSSIVSETDLKAIITAKYNEYIAIDTVLFKGIIFEAHASPLSILADGMSTSNISATLKETNSAIAIPNQVISFGSTLGLIPAVGSTDNRGVVQVSLTSSKTPGTALVNVKYGTGMLKQLNVNFIPKSGTLYDLTDISTVPNRIWANGEKQSLISVKVVDKKNQSVSNDSVHFETSRGSISPEWIVTNNSGIAQAYLTTKPSSNDSTASVRVSRGNGVQSLQTNVEFIGIQMSTNSNPAALIADGKSESEISVILKENSTKISIPNEIVNFSTNYGLIPYSGTTDNTGQVKTTLTSSNDIVTATIIARFGEYFDTLYVPYLPLGQSLYNIKSVVASDYIIFSNGEEASQIIVNVEDQDGNPAQGDTIQFYSTAGRFNFSYAITNASGQAITSFFSYPSEQDSIANITVSRARGLMTKMLNQPIQLVGIKMDINANPSAIIADGVSQSEISVVLKEKTSKISIPNQTIQFSTNYGLISNNGITDITGLATVLLTSSNDIATAEVIARFGQFLDTVQVAFIPEGQNLFFINNIEASSYKLYSNGEQTSQITVYIEDETGNPTHGDTVYFSSTAGRFQPTYALSDASGRAVTSFLSYPSSRDSSAVITAIGAGRILTKNLEQPIQLLGLQMNIEANPTAIIANGQSQTTLSIILKESISHLAIPNETITLSSTSGLIPNNGMTDLTGLVQVSLTSSTIIQTAMVIARFGQFADTLDVPFLPEGQSLYSIKSINTSQYRLLANGEDDSQISVYIEDQNKNPVAGDTIRFQSTAGRFNPIYAVTNISGQAITSFYSYPTEKDSSAVITATRARGLITEDLAQPIKLIGVQMELLVSPDAILANGTSQSDVTVVLKEKSTLLALPSETVYFATQYGLISRQATTDQNGRVVVSLTSSSDPVSSNITATFGEMSKRDTIEFLASLPENLVVTVSPPVIPADGTTASIIKATITDFSNNPVPSGISVYFTKISGPNVNFLNHKLTVNDGTASTSLTSLGTGAVLIEISVASLKDTILIQCTEGPPDQITIVSNKEIMKANGIETATVTATVQDAQGFKLIGKSVNFSTTIGNITPTVATDSLGQARAQFSSGIVGTAIITARVQKEGVVYISASKTIKLTAGDPATVNLYYDPHEMGVKNTGQNQTVTVIASVKDSKNNIVDDSTLVRFSIMHSPPKVTLSSYESIPTVAGEARVSCSSGKVSGSVRIRAEVLQSDGGSFSPEIEATSSELIIHAGPPVIEDINDVRTSHLTVVASRLNIWVGLDTTNLTVLVGDIYNNPVDNGAAVYLTSSGGVVTTSSFTDQNGMVNDTVFAGNPQPTVNRFYQYAGMQDPNLGTIIPGPIPDFEGGLVDNSYDGPGDFIENNGVARIIASVEGVDQNGNTAKAWDLLQIVFSTPIAEFSDNSATVFALEGDTIAYEGTPRIITIRIWDTNGNPIASGSNISAEVVPGGTQAGLSWTEWKTGAHMGQVYYDLTISNAVDPENPRTGWAQVKIYVDSPNGDFNIFTSPFFIQGLP